MAKAHLNTLDREIIDNLLREGNNKRKSEEQLFRHYSYFIREGIHRFNLSEDEAFDAYSDSILSAIHSIRTHSFEEKATIKTWLFKIFRHKCVDLVRKKTTNKSSVYQTTSIDDIPNQLSDPSKSVIQILVDKTDFDLVKQKMAELGDNCRQLLTLYADDYSDKEISEMTGYKTADVAKTSRLRCMERLRQLLKKSQKN